MKTAPRADFRRLEPVDVNPERPEKVSQTLLSHAENCPRAAYFYLRYGGGPQNHRMAGGSLFHDLVDVGTRKLIDEDEATMSGDVAREEMMAVIRESGLVVPAYEMDALRAMAWNWGEATVVVADQVIAVETMYELRIGDWIIRGRIDRADRTGNEVWARDYKTSYHLPSDEDVKNDFQLRLYALLLAEGEPSCTCEDEHIPCGIHGEGFKARDAKGAKEYHVSLEFPRYTEEESGLLVSRSAVITPQDLADFKEMLVILLERLEHGFETAEWPAAIGDHCSRCPSPKECPLPEHLREVETPTSDAEAAELAELWEARSAEAKRIQKSLRGYVKETERPLAYGTDLELILDKSESRTVDSKRRDEMRELLDAGQPVPSDFYKTRTQTTLRRKTRETEEAAA